MPFRTAAGVRSRELAFLLVVRGVGWIAHVLNGSELEALV
jgi:hypothetical protein